MMCLVILQVSRCMSSSRWNSKRWSLRRCKIGVASFFGSRGYLVSVWLTYFTTEHLIVFKKKRGKKFKLPHVLKRFWVRGLVIFREGVSTLNIHSILWEPLDFIKLCYKLACFWRGIYSEKLRLTCFVFFISFEKSFKVKSQVANENWFVFFILKKVTQNKIKSINVWLRKEK